MKTPIVTGIAIAAATIAATLMTTTAPTTAFAALDTATIARATGLTPEVKDGVATVRAPRDDLAVVVDGVKLPPFQGLTSWAAFEESGDRTIVMGDLTLTEEQVNPTMSAAQEKCNEEKATQTHYLFEPARD